MFEEWVIISHSRRNNKRAAADSEFGKKIATLAILLNSSRLLFM
jgi:hypothetical protein